jgi:hypothetical protein
MSIRPNANNHAARTDIEKRAGKSVIAGKIAKDYRPVKPERVSLC